MADRKLTLEEHFWSKVSKAGPDDCWLWTGGVFKFGHGRIWFDGKARYAHRISWSLSNGPIPDGLCVCHTCDVPSCVNLNHLWLGTRTDNNSDRDAKGRGVFVKGAAHGRAKLTEDQVREIRSSKDYGREAAKKYGVAESLIHRIRHRQAWASLP